MAHRNHTLALLVHAVLLASGPGGTGTAAELALQSIHRIVQAPGKESYATFLPANGASSSTNAFRAVVARDWPLGLIPVYAFERRGVYQLSRLAPKGQENFLEPLFFAAPPAGDTDALSIAAHWLVRADHRDGHTSEFAWELTAAGEKVAGRFDPNTDYRFAFITTGTWRTNRIELLIDYINDQFRLMGEYSDDTLNGKWSRADDGDGGTWLAVRDKSRPRFSSATNSVPLYEWIQPETGARAYRLHDQSLPEPWTRAAEPFCQVWRLEQFKE